jgi:hypothetical protein
MTSPLRAFSRSEWGEHLAAANRRGGVPIVPIVPIGASEKRLLSDGRRLVWLPARAEALGQSAMMVRLSAGLRAILTVGLLGLLIPPAFAQDRPARPVPATPGPAGIT